MIGWNKNSANTDWYFTRFSRNKDHIVRNRVDTTSTRCLCNTSESTYDNVRSIWERRSLWEASAIIMHVSWSRWVLEIMSGFILCVVRTYTSVWKFQLFYFCWSIEAGDWGVQGGGGVSTIMVFWTVVLGTILGGSNLVWGIGKKKVFFKKLATTTVLP